MQKNNGQLDLLMGSIWRTLIAFAAPFMLSSLLQTLYNTVDTIVVGQFVGSEGVSALSVSGNLLYLSVTLCMGPSTAGQVLIAQYIGAGRQREIKRIMSTMILLIGGFAIVLSGAFLIFLKPILRLLATPPEAFDMAVEYMTICIVGILFTAFYNMFSAIFRGMGDSRHPFIFITIASIANVVLDLLFVGVFKWGVAGAAYATIIGQAISVVYSFIFLLKHKTDFFFEFGKGEFRPYKSESKMLAKLGVPLMLSGSAINISVLFVTRLINELGVAVSAAFGIGHKLSHIPNILTTAVSQATTAMMGQNLGAGQYDRVRKILKASVTITLTTQLVFVALCLIFPSFSFRLFTPDASVVEYAMTWNIAMAAGALAFGSMGPFLSLIQAVGDSKISLGIGLLDAFVGRVATTIVFGIVLKLGAWGLFMGFNLGAYLTAIPAILYYFLVNWKDRGIRAQKN